MRVLYLSRADEFRDKSSLVIIAKSVLRHLLEQHGDVSVQWVVPAGTKDEVLEEYVLQYLGDAAPRMSFVKCMAGVAGRTLGYMMTEQVWYLLTQTKVAVPYDVVLSNQLALTPIWKTVLTNRYMASRYAVDVPIVNWQMWTATHQQLKEVPEYYAGEADVVAESLSSLFAFNVWESEVLLKAHLDTMRQYVQPSVIAKIREQSTVLANGVDWPTLDEIWNRRCQRIAKDDLGARLFWAGRLANQKKPRVTFPLMEKARRTAWGQALRAPLVSTNRPESDPDVTWARETFPDWQIMAGMDRSAFFGVLSEGDVFLCNSPSESYGVAWLEMLAVGMLGVFQRAWWNETLLPDWYPFVADEAQEQVDMAIVLLRQWPHGRLWMEYVPKVREWIREEHNERATGYGLGNVLKARWGLAVGRDAGKATGSIGGLAHDCALLAWVEGGRKPVPEDEIWRRMKEKSETHRDWGKPGDVVSRMYLRRCLQGNGWIDLAQSPKVEFARRD